MSSLIIAVSLQLSATIWASNAWIEFHLGAKHVEKVIKHRRYGQDTVESLVYQASIRVHH
jgi:hypothetical protein